MRPKTQEIIRIVLQNVNLLPQRAHHRKNRHLFSCIQKLDIDLFTCSETGLCWQLLLPKDQWSECAHPHFCHFWSFIENNRTKIPISKPRQFGGTAILATDNITHPVISTGRDSTGLGRWNCLTTICIISAYHPVRSTGPQTVYARHE